MSETFLQTQLSGGVLRVGLHRPAKKNALSVAMLQSLNESLDRASTDAQIKVVLLHGLPEVFCAGNDLEDFMQQPFDINAPVLQFLRRLVSFDKPLIAAVTGVAVGIGVTLLLHCDVVYAADDAQFALPFVNLGLCPEAGSSLLLPSLTGHAWAAEKLLFGEPFSAEEALAMRIVNQLLPPTDVLSHAKHRAERLAQRPSASLQVTKRFLRAGQRELLMTRIDEEASAFMTLLKAPAAQEAMQAFLEKRRPDFSRTG